MSALLIAPHFLAAIVGATIGALAIALCVSARDADADDEDMRQLLRRQR